MRRPAGLRRARCAVLRRRGHWDAAGPVHAVPPCALIAGCGPCSPHQRHAHYAGSSARGCRHRASRMLASAWTGCRISTTGPRQARRVRLGARRHPRLPGGGWRVGMRFTITPPQPASPAGHPAAAREEDVPRFPACTTLRTAAGVSRSPPTRSMPPSIRAALDLLCDQVLDWHRRGIEKAVLTTTTPTQRTSTAHQARSAGSARREGAAAVAMERR